MSVRDLQETVSALVRYGMKRLLLSWFVLALAALLVVPAEASVHWLWVEGENGERAQQVELSKEFEHGAEELVTLRIDAAVDFAEGELSINGARVVSLGRMHGPVWDRNLRVRLRKGKNAVAFAGKRLTGPAAVAVSIEFLSDEGAERFLVSDESWKGAKSFGRVDLEHWWLIKRRPSTGAFDEYNKGVQRAGGGEDASRFQVPDGFELEVVRAGTEEEGSWVSLEIDPKGRYVIGKEKKGILRMTPDGKGGVAKVEEINRNLQACHGLLFAHDSLFVVANNSRGFFRLRDTNGDDQYDEVKRLREIPGGGGDHGRHALALGKGGEIYVMNGDAIKIPDDFRSKVPATPEFGASKKPLAGHLIRTDKEGRLWEIVASGLRNPFGIALDREGEFFTYDADSESHTGLPWYRPTRILHLVQGADYGWRRSDREIWPQLRPESLPAIAEIGKGSPTGVLFGTQSRFPDRYQRALFAFDWTYGRILAVQLVPQGASYLGYAEVFVSGRPMNVVDLDFEKDGSMLFVTGGQVKQSFLYRLRYTGPIADPRITTPQENARNAYSLVMRRLRRDLAKSHGPGRKRAVPVAWRYLDHDDPYIRNAARTALEFQAVESWNLGAPDNPGFGKVLSALLARIRTGGEGEEAAAAQFVFRVPLGDLSLWEKWTAVRIAALMKEPDPDEVLSTFEPIYPSGYHPLDRELCDLLVRHRSKGVIANTLHILDGEPGQLDAFHYLFRLSQVKEGWTPDLRRSYFRALGASNNFMGDRGLPGVRSEMHKMALANVPGDQRERFAKMISQMSDLPPLDELPKRKLVEDWTLAKLKASQPMEEYTPKPERGKELYHQVLCSRCHRFGSEGRAVGPDLTAVAARFGKEDFLTAVLEPSAAIATNHRAHIIKLKNGEAVTGRVVWNGFRNSTLHVATNPMAPEEIVKIAKKEIVSHEASPVSPMPAGLLNTLSWREVEDLLAYLGVR